MTEQYQDILIKKYLQQTLNEAEKIEFEHLLNTDDDFVQNIYLAKKIRQAEHLALDKSIADYKLKRKTSFIRLFWLVIIALSAIIGVIYFQNINGNNQELDTIKKQKEQAIIDSTELNNKLERDSNKKTDPSVFPPKDQQIPNNKGIKSANDTLPKQIDQVNNNQKINDTPINKEPQFINQDILPIAQRFYKRSAGGRSKPNSKEKSWQERFYNLEKKKFDKVSVTEINDMLTLAQAEFNEATEKQVDHNDLLRFILLNMLVKPPTEQQKKNLDKWLNVKHLQYDDTDEELLNEMRKFK